VSYFQNGSIWPLMRSGCCCLGDSRDFRTGATKCGAMMLLARVEPDVRDSIASALRPTALLWSHRNGVCSASKRTEVR
jgi:hypothetical protein